MAASTVHRRTSKRPRQRITRSRREVHRWIAGGEDCVGIAAGIREEKLSKSDLEKKSLADGDFSGISFFFRLRGRLFLGNLNRCRFDLRWRGRISKREPCESGRDRVNG